MSKTFLISFEPRLVTNMFNENIYNDYKIECFDENYDTIDN